MTDRNRIPARRYSPPPETVKVKDGAGGFLTLNKSDFKPGIHEIYEASVAPAPAVEPASAPAAQAPSRPEEPISEYTVDELRFAVQNATFEELAALRAQEDARGNPRKGAYAVIDEAIAKLEEAEEE